MSNNKLLTELKRFYWKEYLKVILLIPILTYIGLHYKSSRAGIPLNMIERYGWTKAFCIAILFWLFCLFCLFVWTYRQIRSDYNQQKK